eukprot:scaffold12772_cov126-Isochrysis_galbana.AAC.2
MRSPCGVPGPWRASRAHCWSQAARALMHAHRASGALWSVVCRGGPRGVACKGNGIFRGRGRGLPALWAWPAVRTPWPVSRSRIEPILSPCPAKQMLILYCGSFCCPPVCYRRGCLGVGAYRDQIRPRGCPWGKIGGRRCSFAGVVHTQVHTNATTKQQHSIREHARHALRALRFSVAARARCRRSPSSLAVMVTAKHSVQLVGGRLILHGLPHGPNEGPVLLQGRTHREAFQHGDAHVVHGVRQTGGEGVHQLDHGLPNFVPTSDSRAEGSGGGGSAAGTSFSASFISISSSLSSILAAMLSSPSSRRCSSPPSPRPCRHMCRPVRSSRGCRAGLEVSRVLRFAAATTTNLKRLCALFLEGLAKRPAQRKK